MPTVDVKALLSQPSGSFERPPIFPAGHYVGTIVKNEFDKSRVKKTQLIRFFLNPTAAGDDVDPDEIANIDLKKVLWRTEFYLTPTAMYRLDDFLNSVLGESTDTVEDRIPETNGVQVLIGIRQRMNDEGEPTGNEVTTVTAYEE